MASFGELLSKFKSEEEPENIVALVDDKELQNALLAWKSMRIKYRTVSDCSEKDPVAQCDWLWDQIEYDAALFGSVAGLKAQDIGKVLMRLSKLRLIYPDGTVNRFASQYLQSVVMAFIKKSLPRGSQSQSPKATPKAPDEKSPADGV